MDIFESVKDAVPVLLMVIVWGALVVFTVCEAKVKDAGEIVNEAAAAVPVPVRLAVCGLLLALSRTVNVPLRRPVAVGLKVMLMVQLPRPATEVPQVLVCE